MIKIKLKLTELKLILFISYNLYIGLMIKETHIVDSFE